MGLWNAQHWDFIHQICRPNAKRNIHLYNSFPKSVNILTFNCYAQGRLFKIERSRCQTRPHYSLVRVGPLGNGNMMGMMLPSFLLILPPSPAHHIWIPESHCLIPPTPSLLTGAITVKNFDQPKGQNCCTDPTPSMLAGLSSSSWGIPKSWMVSNLENSIVRNGWWRWGYSYDETDTLHLSVVSFCWRIPGSYHFFVWKQQPSG